MKRLFTLLFLFVLLSCKPAITEKSTTKVTQSNAHPSTYEVYARLNNYFSAFVLIPSIEVHNTEGNQKDIRLARHRIQWLDAEEGTKIKIDNDLFSLNDKVTLNTVWEQQDSVDFANNWDEIKLYRFMGRELIGIRMTYVPCTGQGCSVNYFLIYDVATKAKNFFGTFRANNALELYNFNNDYKVDYVAKCFYGDANGATPMAFVYQLYSRNNQGEFQEQRSGNGVAYQLKHTTFPNDSTKKEILEQHWISQVK